MKILKKYYILLFVLILLFLASGPTLANNSLAQKLSGYIVLQVESLGEAWYINPADGLKYFLGRPRDAFEAMRKLGNGITNRDLTKFPVGIIEYNDRDDDEDGLANRLEDALGTDPKNNDTDSDGYNDYTEIKNGYNPLSSGSLVIDPDFASAHSGKIFIQVEKAGEAWYINPNDSKRYYLGRPADAFLIMRRLSLGITNKNLSSILSGNIYYYTPPANPPPPTTPSCVNCSAGQSIAGAAKAIRAGNKNDTIKYFTPAMKNAVEYTMDFLDSAGRLTLGNILSGTKLTEATDTKKTYSTEIYFSMGGYKVPVDFYVEKQENGAWLLANL